MKKTAIITASIVTLTLSGCVAKTGNEKLASMEKNQIDRSIVKGKSTKASVKATFGEPETIEYDGKDNEKWEYTYATAQGHAINYIPIVSAFAAGSDGTRKTLEIYFDKKGVVKNYATSSSKNTVKAGVAAGL